MSKESITASQGPVGSSLVIYNLTVVPTSEGSGTYVAFNVLLFGWKLFDPPLQVITVALPLLVASDNSALSPSQIVWLEPASTTAAGYNSMST